MPIKSESQKQLDELAREEQAETPPARTYAGPKVIPYGLEAGGDVGVRVSPSAKFAEMESHLDPAEKVSMWDKRHKMRTGKK